MTSASTLGRRACAALAVVSAGLHAAMLGHASNLIAAGLLATMIAACLYCARELWRDGTERAWVVVALMNLAMIALHLPAPAHHHGATQRSGAIAVDPHGGGDSAGTRRGARRDRGAVRPAAAAA